KQIIADNDFLITVGTSDPNPTTILEAMGWGLIPVCTPQSGYHGNPGIINIPLNNVTAVVSQLRELQAAPEAELVDRQHVNWKELDQHFNWDRFTNQVIDAIESNESPALLSEPLKRRAQLRWAALTSPFSMIRPTNFARFWGY